MLFRSIFWNLYDYCHLKIIHANLKPNNILLNTHINSKISNFDMIRIVEIDQDSGKTRKIVGTK